MIISVVYSMVSTQKRNQYVQKRYEDNNCKQYLILFELFGKKVLRNTRLAKAALTSREVGLFDSTQNVFDERELSWSITAFPLAGLLV